MSEEQKRQLEKKLWDIADGLRGKMTADQFKDYIYDLDLVAWEVILRSKRELIEKFIEENLWNIKDTSNIWNEFDKFMILHKSKEFEKLCFEENIDSSKFAKLINDYLYTEKMPLKEDIANTLNYKPKLLERKSVTDRIKDKMQEFISVFES